MAPQIKKRGLSYVEPFWFLIISSYDALLALMRLFGSAPRDLLHLSNVKDVIFAQFWFRWASTFALGDEETAVPKLVSQASGVVLELGPGTGTQLSRYNLANITQVYGVEPNIHLHQALWEKAKSSGLSDIYEIIPCGVENTAELERHGVSTRSIDTVLSVQALCSVPRADRVLRRLHALMKPGGQFIVYEHVKSKDMLSAVVQNLYSLVWPFFVGNCHMNCATDRWIMQAGDWEKIELTVPTSEDAWMLFPHVYGHLLKKR